MATAAKLGDYYQYAVNQPVTLSRQKSALLPIVTADVGATRVSIFNPAVQAKHPLLGLRFKNTVGGPLTQGPITVFEGSVYAGDSRILDLQPDEDRLLSYAIDLGTEVSTTNGPGAATLKKVVLQKGILYTETRLRQEKVYTISNRSTTDRTLLIEHQNRKGLGFVFVGPNQPSEEAADVYRFTVPVGAKKDLTYTVAEERNEGVSYTLTNDTDDRIRWAINLKESSPAIKNQLAEALKLKGAWDAARRDLAETERRIATITVDQKRLRDNLRETPAGSELHATYLAKLTAQEKEMDAVQKQQKESARQGPPGTGHLRDVPRQPVRRVML